MLGEREMTYDTFLGKIDAIGINPTYALLLFGSSGESVISFLKGTDFSAPGRYTKMNDLFGWALVLGVVFGLRYFWRDDAHYLRSNVVFLILLFVAIFGFFLVIEIDPESYGAFFMWPAIIVLPGAVLFGGAVARRGSLSVMLILLLAAASLWSGERLRTTMLGQPSISARLSPAFLKYPDGQYAEARAYFETCDLCAKDIAPVLTEIGIFDGNNPGALKPGDAGDIVGAETGTGDVAFQLMVKADARRTSWARRIYVAKYELFVSGRSIGHFTAGSTVPPLGHREIPVGRPFWLTNDMPDPAIY